MKAISAVLILIWLGLLYFMFFTKFFDSPRSYEYSGEVAPSHVLVSDIHDSNDKMNAILSKIVKEEFFRVFRVTLTRPCEFWDRSAKCRMNQCPIDETQKIGNSTHVKTYMVDKTLSQKDINYTNHIPIDTYSDDHNGDQWIFDEHLDTDGIFVDLTKNPERYSGYNGSEIWNELYSENLFRMKFPTKGAHEHFLYRIISGIHVNINMHISSFYLDNIDDIEDEYTSNVYRNYKIFYERIGKYPDRIKNLFYTHMFVVHALDQLKTLLPKYTYDTFSKQTNSLIQNRMLWLGHYINTLIDPELIESDLFVSVSRDELREIIKPAFNNITMMLDCIGWNICKLNAKLQFTGLAAIFKVMFPVENETPTLTENELSGLLNLAHRISNSIKWYKSWVKHEERDAFYKMILFAVFLGLVVILLLVAVVLWFYSPKKREEEKEALQPATTNPSHL